MKLYTLLLIVYLWGTVQSLYIHIGETETKCFLEEIPGETTVVSHYKIELFDVRTGDLTLPTTGIGMNVEVKDPDMKIILSCVYSYEGKISFTSHIPGEHIICLYSNRTAWIGGTQLRVHLDIQVGDQAIDYAQVAQKEKLYDLQHKIRQLVEQVEQIIKEQSYQRFREEIFRQISENTYQQVFYWTPSQLFIMLIMGFWQIWYMQTFFVDKNLV